VAEVFQSSKAVNDLLRSAINATSSAVAAKQRLTSRSSGRAKERAA
jgi:hypothetical protein